MKRKDRTNMKCISCNKGTYKETVITDDWDGTLHCTNCNAVVRRWTED